MSDKPKERTPYKTLAGTPPNCQGHNNQKRLRNDPSPEETKDSEDTGRSHVLGGAPGQRRGVREERRKPEAKSAFGLAAMH